MQEQIRVREGNREKKLSKQRAMLKSLTAQAIKGNTKATNVVIGLLYRLTHAEGAPACSRADLQRRRSRNHRGVSNARVAAQPRPRRRKLMTTATLAKGAPDARMLARIRKEAVMKYAFACSNAVLRHDLAAFVEKTFHTVSPGQYPTSNWHIQAIAGSCSGSRLAG